MAAMDPLRRSAIEAALSRSVAASSDGKPNLRRVSIELSIARGTVQRVWKAMQQRGDGATGAAKPKAADPAALRAELAALMGRDEADPLVTIAVDLRVERDRTESDGPRAAATKEYTRFLAEHRNAVGRSGPMTPDEHIARCHEWVEVTIEAVLSCAEVLTDPRVREAVLGAVGGER